jgi:NADH:ubiquinone oxidoreductase subunit
MGLFSDLFTWWHGDTLGTRLYTWRKGERVGEDGLGNVYYKERDGTRRWVIYKTLSEASQIPPEWHAWIRPNLTGTYEAYRPPGSVMRPRVQEQPLDYEPWSPESS